MMLLLQAVPPIHHHHFFMLHHLWLWLCFTIGMALYMLKRAYYLVHGPNPIANSYHEYVQVCWIPLLFRFGIDAGIYWLTFYPDMFNWLLAKVPAIGSWQPHLDSPLPQLGVVAFFFGVFVDAAVDFLVTKVPWVKEWWPQMPGPMKPSSGGGGS